MFWNLLTASAENSATANGNNNSWIIWVIFIGIAAVYIIMGNRRYKKQQAAAKAEQEKRLAAMKPGVKVTTIGYVCGVIAQVNGDGTFVLETGDADHKSYITFDVKAIAEIDMPEENKEEIEETATEEAPVETTEEENNDAE